MCVVYCMSIIPQYRIELWHTYTPKMKLKDSCRQSLIKSVLWGDKYFIRLTDPQRILRLEGPSDTRLPTPPARPGPARLKTPVQTTRGVGREGGPPLDRPSDEPSTSELGREQSVWCPTAFSLKPRLRLGVTPRVCISTGSQSGQGKRGKSLNTALGRP